MAAKHNRIEQRKKSVRKDKRMFFFNYIEFYWNCLKFSYHSDYCVGII